MINFRVTYLQIFFLLVSDYAVDSDDSSEEERVVVLNANMKTNKRKKK